VEAEEHLPDRPAVEEDRRRAPDAGRGPACHRSVRDEDLGVDRQPVGGLEDLQQPNGPLFKFTLSIVKGRLQGDMAGERDGVVRGHAKVDAAKAEKAK
jgi:hypothetical protein